MFEKKHLNEEELRKVSGGSDYSEKWEIQSTINNIYCGICQKEVKGVLYKQEPRCIYCSICHNFIQGLE